MASLPGGRQTPIDALILEAATGVRTLTSAELDEVLRRVAQAGFDPNAVERAGGRLSGLQWQGRTLRGGDMLPPAEVHYLRHAVHTVEWPDGVTLQEYVQSIEQAIRSATANVFTSRYAAREWQLGVVAPSGRWRGPDGGDWILVEYRLSTGHWTTAYQIPGGDPRLEIGRHAQRGDVRWLRGT
ncbi:MAG: hypothetical protein NTZ05_18405 [Chloroflexi bacterium]|nr:hypothetical protein [Chloroflexota bacterium]